MVEPIQHIDFSAPDEGCDGPYGAVALNLWDQGYATLPVAPLTKKPAVKDWAQRRADDITLAEIVAETVEFSRHNVGVVLGESIVAIDVDSDDPTHLEPVTALCERLGFWKCARRGAKGFALFLRVDEPFKFDGHAEWVQAKFYNHKDPERRSAVVELYTRGRQMVVPPSIHPDTRAPYVWLTQHGLENIPADELPLASARTMMQLAEGLEELGMKVGQPRLRKAAGARICAHRARSAWRCTRKVASPCAFSSRAFKSSPPPMWF